MDKIKSLLAKFVLTFLPLAMIAILIFMVVKLSGKKPEVSPGPGGAEASPTPVLSPTAWASDEEVLGIEKEIFDLEEDLKNVDLKQAPLYPPVLDMEVRFE